MRHAKYYIYRNLHTGGFSVKYRGIVLERITDFLAVNAVFKVSELGRQRVIKDKRKNVHAYIACDYYSTLPCTSREILREITYNPYKGNTFINKADNTPVYCARHVYGFHGIIASSDEDINKRKI